MSLFITFEGIEGCGKTTQAVRLADHLSKQEKRQVLLTREPGGCAVTRQIRSLLADPEACLERRAELLLFLADRAQHVASVIRPALKSGAVVICDRYSDSTIAYQGYGRGHDLKRLHAWNSWASLDTVPDLTLWIDCEVATGLRRAVKASGGPGDRFESEPLDFHERVRRGFTELCKQHPERVVRIDGDATMEEVFARVLASVTQRLP